MDTTSMEKLVTKYLPSVKEIEDVPIFQEALECIDNNNFRAGYIMTWISIVESLKRKLYLLASLESNAAKEAIKLIEGEEALKKPADKLISDQSLICGIINAHQIATLEYLRGRRGVFAHPYEQKPLKSEVIHIVELAIEITIGKSLHYTKPMIKDQINVIVTQPHIISNDIKEIKDYVNLFILRIREEEYLYTYIETMQQIKLWLGNEGKEVWILRRLRNIILCIILRPEVDVSNPKWGFDRSVERFCFETWISAVDKMTWDKLSTSMQNKLINFITFENLQERKIRIYDIINEIFLILNPKERNYIKLIEFYESIPFSSAIQIYPNYNIAYKRIINEISEGSYSNENNVLDFLITKKGLNLLEGIDDNDCVNLGILFAQIRKDNNYRAIDIWKVTKINNRYNFPDSFLVGIFLGYFIDKDLKLSIRTFNLDFPYNLFNEIQDSKLKYFSDFLLNILIKTERTEFELLPKTINKFIKTNLNDITLKEASRLALKEIFLEFDNNLSQLEDNE